MSSVVPVSSGFWWVEMVAPGSLCCQFAVCGALEMSLPVQSFIECPVKHDDRVGGPSFLKGRGLNSWPPCVYVAVFLWEWRSPQLRKALGSC